MNEASTRASTPEWSGYVNNDGEKKTYLYSLFKKYIDKCLYYHKILVRSDLVPRPPRYLVYSKKRVGLGTRTVRSISSKNKTKRKDNERSKLLGRRRPSYLSRVYTWSNVESTENVAKLPALPPKTSLSTEPFSRSRTWHLVLAAWRRCNVRLLLTMSAVCTERDYNYVCSRDLLSLSFMFF